MFHSLTVPPTQLGYLQQFIDHTLIDTFVTNTNLYAAARAATAWVPVTSEEMWQYLAVRIRQGIVQLPSYTTTGRLPTATSTSPCSVPRSLRATSTSSLRPS